MKTILVTTDFSNNSKAGIRFAIQMAKQTKCNLIFYHLLNTNDSNAWIVNNAKGKKAEKAISLQHLNHFVEKICSTNEFPNTKYTCIVEAGNDLNKAISKFIKINAVDFVCISTRGAGELKKLLGTNTSKLIQKCSVPVMVVPKNYRKKVIDSLLYSSDMSNLNAEMLTVKKFAKELTAKIHVYNYEYMIEVDEIKNKLNKMASRFINEGINFNFKKHNIENSISKHLQKDITQLKPAMLVMFTKVNKAWYERWFLSKNSEEVTFDTKIPIVIFRKTVN